MDLLLHIGTEKTGTSSIQRWLTLNDTRLIERGVTYSACLGRSNNRRIALYGVPYSKDSAALSSLGIRSQDGHSAFREDLAGKLAAEVAEARRRGSRVFVISNEHLHSKIDADGAERIASLLRPLFDHVRVLCFLRPQVDLVVSRLSVSARMSSVSRAALKAEADTPYYDYLALLRRWRGVFPDCHFLPYKRHGDVVGALAAELGVEIADFEAPARVNEKLDYRVAQLTRNLGLPRQVAGRANPNREIFMDEMPVEAPISIARGRARAIQARFAETNAALVAECPTLDPADLEPDFDRYPEEGNFDRIFEKIEARDQIRFAILRLNAALWLERGRTQMALAEKAQARGNGERARRFLRAARDMVAKARMVEMEAVDAEAEALTAQIEAVAASLEAGG